MEKRTWYKAILLTVLSGLVAGCGVQMSHLNANAVSCPSPPSPVLKTGNHDDPFASMNAFAKENLRFAEELIGMHKANAEACLTHVGLSWRIVEEDGVGFPATMDYRYNRVNLVVVNDIITRAIVG